MGIPWLGRRVAGGVLILALAACGSPAAGTAPAGSVASGSVASGSMASGLMESGLPAATSPAAGTPAVASSPGPPAAVASGGVVAAPPSVGPARSATAPAVSSPAAPTLPASPPVALSVPAVGIDSPLVELGRNADGSVEVPSLDDPDAKPGWYRDSPMPGSLGPAIILGHVDSRRYGPGVFYPLGDLRPGDGVDITRADGSVAHFVIDAVREVAKRDFPTLEVYGNLDHAGLRLITCGGEFDPDAASYESNIIVFASLVAG